MNNLYICSPCYVKTDHIYFCGIKDLTYRQLIENEIEKGPYDNYRIECVSERFDFLKSIELFNRQMGKIDTLVIASEMWPYGIKLYDGHPEDHWVTIESFDEYPHDWDIEDVKLIGLNSNLKINKDRKTFVESLIEKVKGIIYYYEEPFFKICVDADGKIGLTGEFKTVMK